MRKKHIVCNYQGMLLRTFRNGNNPSVPGRLFLSEEGKKENISCDKKRYNT